MNANWRTTLTTIVVIIVLGFIAYLFVEGYRCGNYTITIQPPFLECELVQPTQTSTSPLTQDSSSVPTVTQTLGPVIPPATINIPPATNNCESKGYKISGNGSCNISENSIEINAMPQLRLNAYAKPSNLHDFSIEVKINLVQSGAMAQYGLVARHFNDCQFYLLLVTPAENKLELKKFLCDEGGYTTLNSTNLTFNPSSEHSLKLEIAGGSTVLITVSVNNNLVFMYPDSVGIIWQGDTGLYVEDAVVQFSDLIINPNP